MELGPRRPRVPDQCGLEAHASDGRLPLHVHQHLAPDVVVAKVAAGAGRLVEEGVVAPPLKREADEPRVLGDDDPDVALQVAPHFALLQGVEPLAVGDDFVDEGRRFSAPDVRASPRHLARLRPHVGAQVDRVARPEGVAQLHVGRHAPAVDVDVLALETGGEFHVGDAEVDFAPGRVRDLGNLALHVEEIPHPRSGRFRLAVEWVHVARFLQKVLQVVLVATVKVVARHFQVPRQRVEDEQVLVEVEVSIDGVLHVVRPRDGHQRALDGLRPLVVRQLDPELGPVTELGEKVDEEALHQDLPQLPLGQRRAEAVQVPNRVPLDVKLVLCQNQVQHVHLVARVAGLVVDDAGDAGRHHFPQVLRLGLRKLFESFDHVSHRLRFDVTVGRLRMNVLHQIVFHGDFAKQVFGCARSPLEVVELLDPIATRFV